VYRKGRENKVVDALSRIPNLMAIQSCFEQNPMWIQEVINSYVTDQHAMDLLAQLAVTSPNEQGYTLH
jgi:hypothetical protein